jgi:hypothetical protein
VRRKANVRLERQRKKKDNAKLDDTKPGTAKQQSNAMHRIARHGKEKGKILR